MGREGKRLVNANSHVFETNVDTYVICLILVFCFTSITFLFTYLPAFIVLNAATAAADLTALSSLYSLLRLLTRANLAACSSVPATKEGSRIACNRARIGFAREVNDEAPTAPIVRAATISAFEIVLASSTEKGSVKKGEEDIVVVVVEEEET